MICPVFLSDGVDIALSMDRAAPVIPTECSLDCNRFEVEVPPADAVPELIHPAERIGLTPACSSLELVETAEVSRSGEVSFQAIAPPETESVRVYSDASFKLPLTDEAIASEPQSSAAMLPVSAPEAMALEMTALDDIPVIKTPNRTAPLPTLPAPPASAAPEVAPDRALTVFPVGITAGPRSTLPAVLIRGQENGAQATQFQDWLVPYSTVVEVLQLDVEPQPDGQLSVRSPGLVTTIDPNQLRTDPQLGLVISIADIEALFGVPARFDINDYAIEFSPPWLGQRGSRFARTEAPVVLDGLPVVNAPEFSIAAVETRLNVFDTSDRPTDYRGDVSVVGTVLGHSWFLEVDQPDLGDTDTWNLDEVQLLRQTPENDYLLGSQRVFWPTNDSTEIMGGTFIQRNGFDPVVSLTGSVNPELRLQADNFGISVTGEAEPGTLTRLVRGFRDEIVAEELVDSSGRYRFDDVEVGNGQLGSYRVLLYPNGRTSSVPETRDVTFDSVSGQIPQGSSAWIASAGWNRDLSSGSGFFGELEEFRGGAAYRRGISDNLTLGVGGVVDNGPRALGELFLQAGNFPLRAAVSVLTPDADGDWEYDANVRFDPTPTLSARFSANTFNERLRLDWRVLPRVTLFGKIESDQPDEVGIQTSFNNRDGFLFTRVSLDTEGELGWNILSRIRQLELVSRGGDFGSFNEVSYNLKERPFLNEGSSAFVSHEHRVRDGDDGELTTLGWRYRSRRRARDGRPRWQSEVGYLWGRKGSGPLLSLETAVLPGISLEARYEAVSGISNDDSFRLQLVSSTNLQRGVRAGNRRADVLRTNGGLLVMPFFDENGNGDRDPGEQQYTENPELLLILNNRPIGNFRSDISDRQILVELPPGQYRLDLDPAGFPLDWQSDITAMAVEVSAGSFTPIDIPLVPSYTISGVITDNLGNPVSGARIEAISPSGDRRFSVTNNAGVYFLERLRRETYDVQINGSSVETLPIFQETERFSERNFEI